MHTLKSTRVCGDALALGYYLHTQTAVHPFYLSFHPFIVSFSLFNGMACLELPYYYA